MVKNKKISGVLIENKIKKNNSINSVMGIGINVNQEKFPDFLSATSIINEIGSVTEIDSLANELAAIIKFTQIGSSKTDVAIDSEPEQTAKWISL